MKRQHEIIILGKRDGSRVPSKFDCVECKNKEEVIQHKEAELDKREKHIKNITPKTNEIKNYKEELELARKTISENVQLISLVITERDTLKAMRQVEDDIIKAATDNSPENVEPVQETRVVEDEIIEFLGNKCKKDCP